MILSNKPATIRKMDLYTINKLIRFTFITAFLLIASACSQLPNFMGQSTPQNTDAANEKATLPTNDKATSDTLSDNAIPQLSPEQLKIQELSARPNMYALSKRTLSAQTKQEVLAALKSFQAAELSQSQQQINEIINNRLDANSAVFVLAGDIEMAHADNKATSSTNKQNDAALEQTEEHSMKAQQLYQKALSLNPDNAKAANRLAKLLREQGDFTQAEALYSQAIAAQPMHASTYRNRAVLRDLYMNKKALALQDYQDYSVLLSYQQEQSEQGVIQLPEQSQKALAKDIKLVSRWIVDVKRQVNALAKAKAANNANTGTGE